MRPGADAASRYFPTRRLNASQTAVSILAEARLRDSRVEGLSRVNLLPEERHRQAFRVEVLARRLELRET